MTRTARPFQGTKSPTVTFLSSAHTLLSFWVGEDGASQLLQTLDVEIHPCVVDTNFLLRDVKYSIVNQRTTALLMAARHGGLRLFATTCVRDEVSEHMGDLVEKYGIDVKEAQRVWEQDYAPLITFLDPSELPLLSPKVVMLLDRDADDVPTAQLIELLQPDIAFSDDHDLAAFGVIGKNTAVVTCAYRDITKRDSLVVSFHIGGNMVISFTAATVESAVTMLRPLVAKIDKRLVALLASVVVALLAFGSFHPTSRRWLSEHTKGFQTMAKIVIDELAKLTLATTEARKTVASIRLTTKPSHTARGYITFVLARAAGPLTVAIITHRIREQGYQARSTHPEQHVRHILRNHPLLFERVGKHKWQLRSHPITRSEAAK